MTEIVGMTGEISVGRFQGWMNIFFYSLYSFQVFHVFKDVETHLGREELCKDHALLTVKPDFLNFNSGDISIIDEKVVHEEASKGILESDLRDRIVGEVERKESKSATGGEDFGSGGCIGVVWGGDG